MTATDPHSHFGRTTVLENDEHGSVHAHPKSHSPAPHTADVLEGLTSAINVDQQRIGSDPRSTVGTATDTNAMLRILFSRLGRPHIGPPSASPDVPSDDGGEEE